MNYQEKINLIKEKLGKTPAELNAERFAKQALFVQERKRIKDEEEKANQEAQEQRKALQAAENERVRLETLKLEDAAVKLKKRSQALAQRESEERQVRRYNAQLWVDKKNEEARMWLRKNTRLHTGQPLSSGEIQNYKRAGICEPKLNWFDTSWYIKEQFKQHYSG
ncbi:hypothetical protein AB4259_02775 [Vibrio amylolyticus]|uniref:hypothetical protein n=1 Tax=Vibrio amylolyticus TaxID=2847292 RepID=UPI003550FA15